MGCAQIDHTPYGLVRSPRAPAVGVACLAPVKREITFPLLTVRNNTPLSPGVWVHPSYGVRTDRPHSVWSCALSVHLRWALPALHQSRGNNLSPLGCVYLREYGFTPVMGCAQIPHSVWSCALSEGTCGGRCLPCTSQEGNNLSLLTEDVSPGVWVHPSYGVQIDHTPYGLVRSPRAPAVGVACLAPVKREITFPLLTEYAISGSMGSPQLWGAHR